MASGFALIPCEICNNLFTIDEYMTHAATHQQPNYSSGTMYGPLPKPQDWKEPYPQSVVTNDDYTILPNGDVQYNTGNMYGAKKQTESVANNETKSSMEDEKKSEIQEISQSDANSMRDIGCVLIKNGVRKDLIQNALRLINNALAKGPKCLSNDEYIQHNDILDLFNESAAFSLCQNILGLSNVVIPKVSKIKLLFPTKVALDDNKAKIDTMNLKWSLDGLLDNELPPFSLGMRVILNKQTFVFYKATHLQVFEQLKADGIDSFIKDNRNNRKSWQSTNNALTKWDVDKGDIVLYHPFLCLPPKATADTENIDYYVDFRVNHKHFNGEIGAKRAKHLWLGYESLKDALINEVLSI